MILVKTDAGQQMFKDRAVRLTPRQRSAFILCDSKRSIDEVLAAGMGITREDLDQMIQLGLLESGGGATLFAPVAGLVAAPVLPSTVMVETAVPTPIITRPSVAVPPLLSVPSQTSARSAQQRYKEAYPIATRLTGALGLRGFRLNLSVEGTSNYDELLALIPKIRSAVGPEKAAELDRALEG